MREVKYSCVMFEMFIKQRAFDYPGLERTHVCSRPKKKVRVRCGARVIYEATRSECRAPVVADCISGQSYSEDVRITSMFVRRRFVDNKVKVETFPIKRARVRKEISLWSGHVPINLALPADFMLKTTIKRFTQAKGIASTRDSAGFEELPMIIRTGLSFVKL